MFDFGEFHAEDDRKDPRIEWLLSSLPRCHSMHTRNVEGGREKLFQNVRV